MPSRFYKQSDIINNQYYAIPQFINNIDFSGIASKKFVIQDGDRLDIIAEQLYGDPNYWKEIMLFNNLGYFFIPIGTVIRLPIDIKAVSSRI